MGSVSQLPIPKAVIFDWDNTLVNTWPVIHGALFRTFEQYGLEPWTLEETKSRVAHSLRDSFPKLFGEGWEEAGKAYQAHYIANHLAELEVLAEAEDVLRYLKEKGVYIALVSNKRGPTLRKEVAHLGWEGYFSAAVGSGDVAHDKPHPAPVFAALEGSGVEPAADVWFVGDTHVDLEIARNTGCTPVLYGDVLVETLVEGGLRYQGYAVSHHTRSHGDFLSLLRRLFG